MISLVDRWGRRITRLRLAVSDQCNLRCVYCRPRAGASGATRGRLLSTAEIMAVVEAAVACGVSSIRLTGGEPLLREDLLGVIGRIAGLRSGLDIAVTTNGILLSKLAGPLSESGLNRVNVSLDSLRGDRFRAITGHDSCRAVVAGLKAAARAGLWPIKVNVVLMRGRNDDEALDMVQFAADHGYQIRFIEFMPLDGEQEWLPDAMVCADEVRAQVEGVFGLTPLPAGDSPGDEYLLGPGPTRVSFIGPISHPFCDRCNRIRVTADGFLRPCLFSRSECDLHPALASDRPQEALIEALSAAAANKPAGHGVSDRGFVRPARAMFAIGG